MQETATVVKEKTDTELKAKPARRVSQVGSPMEVLTLNRGVSESLEDEISVYEESGITPSEH